MKAVNLWTDGIMKTKGIRILDDIDNVISVKFFDILKEIENGNSYHWAILFLWGVGDLGEDKSMVEFENQINHSERGLFISWDDMCTLSTKFHQIIDILIIGCVDKNLLRRYENDQEMYETCDIVIEMFDSSFWGVFSKNDNLIDRLAVKFKEVKFLESDFKK